VEVKANELLAKQDRILLPPEPIYMCSCPEDKALIEAAKNLGVKLADVVADEKDPNIKYYIIKIMQKDKSELVLRYQLLDLIKFKSSRKRSSVILGAPEVMTENADGSITYSPAPPAFCQHGCVRLYMKGADSFVRARLEPAKQDDAITKALIKGSKRFGQEGLRGLLYAYRDIPQATYDEWKIRWDQGQHNLADIPLHDEMENGSGCIPLGVCGLEDALQVDVGNTIKHLAQANIPTWILTGDKTDTAIMIGYACSLLYTSHEVVLFETDMEATDTLMMFDACRSNPRKYKDINALLDKYYENPLLPEGIELNALGECKDEQGKDIAFEKLINTDSPREGWKSELIRGAYSDKAGSIVTQMNRQDFVNKTVRWRLKGQMDCAYEYFFEGSKYCPVMKEWVKKEPSRPWYRLNTEEPPNNLWLCDISEQGYQRLCKDNGGNEPKWTLKQKMELTMDHTVMNDGYHPDGQGEKYVFFANIDEDSGKAVVDANNETKEEPKYNIFYPCGVGPGRSQLESRGELAMVVEGPALMQLGIGKTDPYPSHFTRFGSRCAATVCCVMQPSWKAQVAECVKEHMGKTVLCVGDGANDVPMIKAAHVGVGIAGVEGQGAKNASDFAVTQFRHLERIVLIHGRYSYMRVAYCCMYIIYKAIVFCLAFALFAPYSGWSGQLIYDVSIISGFNMIWTSFPILMWGCFERDVSARKSIRFPYIYQGGQSSEFMNKTVFVAWVLEAFYHAFVTFFFSYMIIGYRAAHDGTNFGVFDAGNTCFTVVLFTVALRLCMDTRSYSWPTHLFYWGSLAFWFIFIIPYCSVSPELIGTYDVYYSYNMLMENILFWVTCPLAVFMCLLPALAVYAVQVVFAKNEKTQLVFSEEMEKKNSWVKEMDQIFTLEPDSYTNFVYDLRKDDPARDLAKSCKKGSDEDDELSGPASELKPLDQNRQSSFFPTIGAGSWFQAFPKTDKSASDAMGTVTRAQEGSIANTQRQTSEEVNRSSLVLN
jgi:magnesium-transporting ATPase (P-type)